MVLIVVVIVSSASVSQRKYDLKRRKLPDNHAPESNNDGNDGNDEKDEVVGHEDNAIEEKHDLDAKEDGDGDGDGDGNEDEDGDVEFLNRKYERTRKGNSRYNSFHRTEDIDSGSDNTIESGNESEEFY